jgi:D-glycero-D-manno-heptose 1,7-bisphosphate phosphatase
MKAAAFLDRDGVLNATIMKNGTPCPPSNISEVEILPGVQSAIDLLIQKSYLPVVITNQPDVARGCIGLAEIEVINEYIGRKIGVSRFYVCPHDDIDECSCRKPKPGLILAAAKELEIDLSKSFLVGDRWRDIEAGQALGLPSYFIEYSYSEKVPKQPFVRVTSLLNAVRFRFGVSNGFEN